MKAIYMTKNCMKAIYIYTTQNRKKKKGYNFQEKVFLERKKQIIYFFLDTIFFERHQIS
jgi:AMMECR1 domain-containing protein